MSVCDEMLYYGCNGVDIVTADTSNLRILYVGVHKHRRNACGLKLLEDGAVELCAEDHKSAVVVFLAKLFEVGCVLVRAMLDNHLVAICVCRLLEARKHGVADLGVVLRVHVLEEDANSLCVLIAV